MMPVPICQFCTDEAVDVLHYLAGDKELSVPVCAEHHQLMRQTVGIPAPEPVAIEIKAQPLPAPTPASTEPIYVMFSVPFYGNESQRMQKARRILQAIQLSVDSRAEGVVLHKDKSVDIPTGPKWWEGADETDHADPGSAPGA